ncbi:segregation/condensation protein A [Myxacorys almedinensis]|uniref:Segregation and condensation protein A n=1 Tax=Myxacorys almedinensis A TaxID=2690445 RepID=A0A8J7Z1D1_9CYAN|nr:ScpA family protein [Myxacorys almedinensis]NDJ15986.1 segregation/condensation protein A [Myxacorys almedinensis A]
MAAPSLAQDAIALLIDMAERGDLDPWNVNVIDVIDRFLSDLAPATGRELYEANLSQSGQAFLYASMLLLLKAQTLTQEVVVEPLDDFPDDGFLDGLELGQSALPLHLERQLRRRAVAHPPQRRRVTLKELIEQIQIIATALDDRAPRRRPTREKMPRAQAVRAIAQLAHQENLSEMAVAIEDFFINHWSLVAQGQDWIDFELVLEFWVELKAQGKTTVEDDPHAQAENHERVGVFWALLLLSSQNKVELAQEEFYQDLKVRSLLQRSSELEALTQSALLD